MYKPLMVALVLAASGCGGGGAAGTPAEAEPGGTTAPASLTLNHTTASLAAGGSLQLSATPVNAGGAAMTGLPAPSWSTSDPAIAHVADGMVTAVAPGSAIITATLTAGGATRTATVSVTVTPRPAAFTTLALTGGTVAVGATLPLTATALDQNGQPMTGLPAPSFVTSDASRATVSGAGVVTGVAAGTATITASLTAGGVTRTATATVNVTATPQGGGGGSATVRGLEHAFSPSSVTITPGGTVTWTMVDDEHDVTWTGAAPPQGNIPKMDEGDSVTRTFPTAGTYTYRCARHENHDETGTVVVQGAPQGGAVFTSVSVSPATPGVSVGGTTQLAASARDQNGQAMAGLPAATWSTSDASRATVSASGLVTGVAAGSVTVTASITSGGVTRTGSATVTVSAGTVTNPTNTVVTTPGSSFAPPSVTIGVGGTVTWEISGATHNVTFGGAAPQGGNIPDTRTGSISRQFTTAGTYEYQCTRHSGMQGRVVVQ
ncbi:MAG TPA: Ig-like domain-containing protein [Longimicrobium sp.]|jgi:plastocyanin